MKAKNEFCPHCNSVQVMFSAQSEKIVKDSSGKKKKIIIYSFTCQRCKKFVCSEEKVFPAEE